MMRIRRLISSQHAENTGVVIFASRFQDNSKSFQELKLGGRFTFINCNQLRVHFWRVSNPKKSRATKKNTKRNIQCLKQQLNQKKHHTSFFLTTFCLTRPTWCCSPWANGLDHDLSSTSGIWSRSGHFWSLSRSMGTYNLHFWELYMIITHIFRT